MSNQNWITPEEIARRKVLRKRLLYASFLILIGAVSALVTILANQL